MPQAIRDFNTDSYNEEWLYHRDIRVGASKLY
jgi:hypothetical protein